MSKNSNIMRSIRLLFVFVVSTCLVGADLVLVTGQNANSGMTMESQNGNMTGNTTTGRRGRRRRGARRRRGGRNTMGAANTGMAADNMSGTADNTNMTGDTQDTTNTSGGMTGMTTGGGRRRRGRRRRGGGNTMATTDTATTGTTTGGMTENATGGEQTDLSGTYTGTVNYAGGGLSGPATLTIEGNRFTLTPEGGSPLTGRVTAV
ncbi:MAG TPA: hypothetical protein VF723_16240, partial [Pyrinomonadaceae bacterium]